MTEYVRINRQFEKLWFPKVKKALQGKVSSLIEKIQQDGIDAGQRYLQTDIGNFKLNKVIGDLYQQVGLRHARRTEIRLRAETSKFYRPTQLPIVKSLELKRFGFAEAWAKRIRDYLMMHLIEKITFKVNETTRNKLLDVLQESINNGWGITETISHLEDLPFTGYQAARIVRTEVNRAANVGVLAQGAEFEYELMKTWISVRDNRTRGVDPEDHADHARMNGQTVDFDSVFIDPRNGHELKIPGDTKAPGEDTINCRCQMTTKAKRDDAGRLIRKRQLTTV